MITKKYRAIEITMTITRCPECDFYERWHDYYVDGKDPGAYPYWCGKAERMIIKDIDICNTPPPMSIPDWCPLLEAPSGWIGNNR